MELMDEHSALYKTEVCRHWAAGFCRFGGCVVGAGDRLEAESLTLYYSTPDAIRVLRQNTIFSRGT